MTVGQWMWDATGARWHFESGSLALDFGYTGDWGYGVPEWERLHAPADLQQWVADHLEPLAETLDPEDLARARQLRGSITRLAVSAADGKPFDLDDVDRLNDAAAAPPVRPRLAGGSAPDTRPTFDSVLSTIAEEAIFVLSHDGSRVRRCGGQDCELVFFDHSRPNRRRWCSMQRCGNRAKARAHRTQQRGT